MLSNGHVLYVPGVGQWDGVAWTYQLPDGLGSLALSEAEGVRQLADAQGYLVQRYDYSPFGEALTTEGKRTNSLRYTGEQWDSDVGLLYLRARWYDPSVGRFTTRDPFPGLAALPQTQHPYVYVGNNPINLTDPSGKFVFVPFLIAAGVGAAIGGIGAGIAYAVTHPCEGASSGFWRAVGVGAFSGGVAGLMSLAVPLLLPAAGGFWSAVGIGALSGSLAGGAGQVTVNVFTPGADPFTGVPEAMLVGGITGGIAGGVGYGIGQWASTKVIAAAAPEPSYVSMPKPQVQDPKLQSLVNDLYRPGSSVGSGSTADAIRQELATGQPVKGHWHSQKGEDYVRALQKWLQRNPAASPGDRAAAENVVRDILDALGRKR